MNNMNNMNNLNFKNIFRAGVFALLFASVFLIIPASAELEPKFDWEIYQINTADWVGYDDKYDEYDGIIYEVHFEDMTGGAIKGWSWEFGDDDWFGSTKENPIKIFTEEEAVKKSNMVKVTLTVTDTSGVPYSGTNYVFLDPEDPWNLKTVYTLTPEPTAAPTTAPTTAPPTAAPTVAPTAEPTAAASHTFEVPGISKELKKLHDSFEDYILVIKAVFKIS